MSDFIGWMAAEAERPPLGPNQGSLRRRDVEDGEGWARRARDRRVERETAGQRIPEDLPRHQFPQMPGRFTTEGHGAEGQNPADEAQFESLAQPSLEIVVDEPEFQRQRRIYRGRTVGMLRRYMRYSIETGRLPSLLGREFFRAKVTSYTVVTFEDRVIFVHDMERCLDRLDGFSRKVLARIVLQEYEDAARLLGCTRMTAHRKLLEALDGLSALLLEVGLLDRVPNREKACQGGNSGVFSVSDSEDGK